MEGDGQNADAAHNAMATENLGGKKREGREELLEYISTHTQKHTHTHTHTHQSMHFIQAFVISDDEHFPTKRASFYLLPPHL